MKKEFKVKNIGDWKFFRSEEYNYNFNKKTGLFQRWGKEESDDPECSPFGPEILDFEIVEGKCSGGCAFCYKSSSSKDEICYTSLKQYKEILTTFPKTLNQVALGITDLNANPDLLDIIKYTRSIGIIPNITINGNQLTNEWIKDLSENLGGIAISHYSDKKCFAAIEKFNNYTKQNPKTSTLKQINIHKLLSKETYNDCLRLIDEAKLNPQLNGLNAIVYLGLKPKGKTNNFNILNNQQKFTYLFKYALDNNISVGMDSCTAPLALKASEQLGKPELFQLIEPCESFGAFSSYVNVFGQYFPCSFAEGEGDWKEGLQITKETNFIKDIWNNKKLLKWKDYSKSLTKDCNCNLKSQCRICPIFDITICKKLTH